MLLNLTFNLAGAIQRSMLGNRLHYVVPAAIIPDDGVLVGNCGAVLYPGTENKKYALAWNTKPIVAYHPEEGSAASAEILNTRGCGLLLNTVQSRGKLRTMCWFDVEKTKVVDPRIIENLEKGKPIECSTGLEVDFDETPGETKGGVKYERIARNYRPDHLAVFVDMKGAYSVSAGGGVMQLNAADLEVSPAAVLEQSTRMALMPLRPTFVDNELSFQKITCDLSCLLSEKFGEPGKHWFGFVEAVYDGKVIFCDGEGKKLMLKYTSADDVVALKGNPVEVDKVTEYRTADGKAYTANAAGGLDEAPIVIKKTPTPETPNMDRKKHIDMLINSNSGWTEADRPALDAMKDEVLAKIKPAVVANANPPADPPAPVNPPADIAARLATAGFGQAEIEFLTEGVSLQNSVREGLVRDLLAYPQNQFPKEVLDKTPIGQLRMLHNMIPRPAAGTHFVPGQGQVPIVGPGAPTIAYNFAGAAGGAPVVTNGMPAVPTVGLDLPKTDYTKKK